MQDWKGGISLLHRSYGKIFSRYWPKDIDDIIEEKYEALQFSPSVLNEICGSGVPLKLGETSWWVGLGLS